MLQVNWQSFSFCVIRSKQTRLCHCRHTIAWLHLPLPTPVLTALCRSQASAFSFSISKNSSLLLPASMPSVPILFRSHRCSRVKYNCSATKIIEPIQKWKPHVFLVIHATGEYFVEFELGYKWDPNPSLVKPCPPILTPPAELEGLGA